MIIEKVLRLKEHSIHTRISGQGRRAIVFIHGNSGSSQLWQAQLGDAQFQLAYQLVSFDLPGHGQSGRGADYRLKEMARLIPALIKELGLTEYLIVGLSYGSCLAAEAAPELAGCRGYMMVSPNLVSNEYPPASFFLPLAPLAALAAASATDVEVKQFAELLVYSDRDIIGQYSESYKATDPAFRTTLGRVIGEGEWSDELSNLKDAGVPVCIVFGEGERAIRTDYLNGYEPKWGDKTHHIKGAGHFVNAERPEAFNKLLGAFAADVFK